MTHGSNDHFNAVASPFDSWNYLQVLGIVLEIDILLLFITSIVFFVYTFNYWKYKADKLRLHYQETSFHKFLLESCPSLHKTYFPPFWMFTSHLQGGMGLVLRTNIDLPLRKEIVKGKDGAHLLLNWMDVKNASEGSPVVIILPGVTGGCDKPYISHLSNECHKRNWNSCILIFPGCLIKGTDINLIKSPRFFSPVDTSDVSVVLNHIQNKFPKSPIIGVGHSMGAAILTKYLAVEGTSSKLAACLSVSNPWNFVEIANNISQKFVNRNIYNRHFFDYWYNAYKQNADVFKQLTHVNWDAVDKATSLQELEDRLTRQVYRYKNTDDYYKDSSCHYEVPNIKIPFFAVQALDDPVVPYSAIPFESLANNPNCFTVVTKSGGHSGWLEGWYPVGLCFADRLCLEFISSFIQYKQGQIAPRCTSS